MPFRLHRSHLYPSFALLLLLLFAQSVFAAERTRRPVEALPVLADGSGFIYKQVADFRDIAPRLALSNAARCLSILDREPAGFFELLRRWPCESMAFFSGEELRETESEATYIVAAYPDDFRKILKKVEIGVANGQEALALFSDTRRVGVDEEGFSVTVVDDGSPYRVRCRGFRLYFTARDNLLIGSFRESDLKYALAALASGRHFTHERAAAGGRNFAVFDMGRSLSREVMREIFYMKSMDEKEALRVEADFAFEPGGWKLDVRSNLIALMGLDGLKKTGGAVAVGSARPFERLGGGRLVAAASLRAVPGMVLFDTLRSIGEARLRNMDPSVYRELLAPSARRFAGVERIDAGLVSYAGERWPNGFGAYSATWMPDRERMEKLREDAARNRAEFGKEAPYTELESGRWKPLYAIDVKEEGIAAPMLFGYADDAFLSALLPEGKAERPFETGRAYFEELAAKPGDFLYADLRAARTAMREMRAGLEKNAGQRRFLGEFVSLLLALTSDIAELSVTSEREGVASIRAKTARPDIDERMWLYELMEEIR